MAARERLVAIRALVADIVNGTYDNDEGPRVVSPQGIELRRVMLVGNVVDQIGNDNFASITIDDGTETIRAKAWGSEANMLQSISGNILALVIGKIKEYNDEIYLAPEIIRELDDPNLMTVHQLERRQTLLRMRGKEVKPKAKTEDTGTLMSYDTSQQSSKPKKTTPSKTAPTIKGLSGEILQFIKENEEPKGVRIEEIAEYFSSKKIDTSKIQLNLIDLVDQELVIEEEIGLYRTMK